MQGHCLFHVDQSEMKYWRIKSVAVLRDCKWVLKQFQSSTFTSIFCMLVQSQTIYLVYTWSTLQVNCYRPFYSIYETFAFSELIWYLPSQNQIRCVWTDVSSCFEISCEMILVKHWEVANFWLARYCWTSWMFYLNLTPQPWKQKCVRDDYIKVIKYRTTRLKKWA